MKKHLYGLFNKATNEMIIDSRTSFYDLFSKLIWLEKIDKLSVGTRLLKEKETTITYSDIIHNREDRENLTKNIFNGILSDTLFSGVDNIIPLLNEYFQDCIILETVIETDIEQDTIF